MRNLTTALAAGAIFMAGYFVGFYEMKYKVLKAMVETTKKEES